MSCLLPRGDVVQAGRRGENDSSKFLDDGDEQYIDKSCALSTGEGATRSTGVRRTSKPSTDVGSCNAAEHGLDE